MELITVRPGQDLTGICRKYGVDRQELIWLDQLCEAVGICPGQCLLLPGDSRPAGELELAGGLRLGSQLPLELPKLSWLIIRGLGLRCDGSLLSLPRLPSFPRGTLPILSVSPLGREGFCPRLAHRLLEDDEAQERFADELAETVLKLGFRGAELDFQHLYGFDRDSYTAFVQRLSQRLHQEGAYLLLALAPQGREGDCCSLCAGQDLKALAPWADRFILLLRELNGPEAAPQPPAPLGEIRRCLEYALEHIPAGKIMLSLGMDACTWPLPWRKGDRGRMTEPRQAAALAASQGAEIRYDRSSGAAFFTYSLPEGRRIAWMEDLRSLARRMELAKELGLGGMELPRLEGLWRPAWKYIEDSCYIRQLP